MSTPAGWYDDGQGRQRWWDGTQWTDNYSDERGSRQIPVAPRPATVPQDSSERPKPILGYIGLGLAVVGAVLAFFPITFAFALVVLFAAFVVGLIGLFKRGAAKWPSITAMVLSPLATVLGFIVVLGIIATGLWGSTGGEATGPGESSQSGTEPTAPAEDEAGPNEFSIGDGITMELSIETLQLDEPTGFQGAAPTADEYSLYWGNAQTTDGQLAVVTATVHNRSGEESPTTPVSVSLMRTDLTKIESWSVAEEGFDLSLFNLELPAGGSESFTFAYPLSASEIDSVVVETFVQKDIGEGNRIVAYQDAQGQGCGQLTPEAGDPATLWSCLQKK